MKCAKTWLSLKPVFSVQIIFWPGLVDILFVKMVLLHILWKSCAILMRMCFFLLLKIYATFTWCKSTWKKTCHFYANVLIDTKFFTQNQTLFISYYTKVSEYAWLCPPRSKIQHSISSDFVHQEAVQIDQPKFMPLCFLCCSKNSSYDIIGLEKMEITKKSWKG